MLEDKLQELRRLTILDPNSWKQNRLAALEEFVVQSDADAAFLLDVSNMVGCSSDIRLLALKRYSGHQKEKLRAEQEREDEEQQRLESQRRAQEIARYQKREAVISAEIAKLKEQCPHLESLQAFLNHVSDLTIAQERLYTAYTNEKERIDKEAKDRERLASKEIQRERMEIAERQRLFEEDALEEAQATRRHLEAIWARDAINEMAYEATVKLGRSVMNAKIRCSKCGGDMSRDSVTGLLFHTANFSVKCVQSPVAA